MSTSRTSSSRPSLAWLKRHVTHPSGITESVTLAHPLSSPNSLLYCEVYTDSGRWDWRNVYVGETSRDYYVIYDGEFIPHSTLASAGLACAVTHFR